MATAVAYKASRVIPRCLTKDLCSLSCPQRPALVTAQSHLRAASPARAAHVACQAAATSGKAKGLPYQTSKGSSPPEADSTESAGPDSCFSSLVHVDNTSHPNYTVLELEAQDYPGLLRIISWVLNGMLMRVAHAVCTTVREDDMSVARDKFWITDVRGRKLSDASATSLAERLEDFVMYCAPDASSAGTRQVWKAGSFEISNVAHPTLTQLIIRGEPTTSKPGYLLELSSVLSSIGAVVHEAVIQGGPDAPVPAADVAEKDYNFGNGRYFRFLLSDLNGDKMDESRISAIIFSLNLVGGTGHMPIVAPNMENILQRVKVMS